MTRDNRLRASYDADGNIILSAADDVVSFQPQQHIIPALPSITHLKPDPPVDLPDWIARAEEEGVAVIALKGRDPTARVAAALTHLRGVTHDALSEGFYQYARSATGAKPVLHEMRLSATRGGRALWAFLTQPVWVPTRKRTLKEYSRGTLFLIDVVRFGCTFALIFFALFAAMNYQSFWQITVAQMDKFLSGASISALTDGETSAFAALAAKDRREGDVLSYLPSVGPPENRIFIPKLRLNVPLVQPSYDALLRQDWDQVEIDIQEALQHGVVHYPGTARPGQAGNFFVTGHSSNYFWVNSDYNSVFARLHELVPGDEYTVYFNGDKHRYIVRSKKEVLPSDVTVLDQPADARIATLMTCTPVGTTLRRLVIRAEEVDLQTGVALKVGERTEGALQARPQLEALPI